MANSSFQKLQDLDLSRDEVERIGEALKKEEFRKLLVEYVEDVQNPENKKLYEEEITLLEKERGIDVTFINPEPGYTIKTSSNGDKKCFINVCVNEHIQKPSSTPGTKDGTRGLQWSLPHSLTPPREDLDNKRVRCDVYDVVFHPDTLHLAHKNKEFYQMLNKTALEAVETNFDVKLDTKNLKFPKLQYKGLPQASIVRKPSKEPSNVEDLEPAEKEFMEKMFAEVDSAAARKPSRKVSRKSDDKSMYTTPKYVIKHRSHVDIQDFTEHKHAKLNSATPKELIVEISLPLLKSSADITLDVTEKTVQLTSEKPSKYKLNLTLPYRVNQDGGNAKFEKDQRKLMIVLPVKRSVLEYTRDDSGVESDQSPATPESEDEPSGKKPECSEESVISGEFRTSFLDSDLHYNLPEFTCHKYENVLAFTLNVKNVDQSSMAKVLEDSSLHIQFTSVGSSFYPIHHAFYIQLPTHQILSDQVLIEVWDNNVILQVPVNCDTDLNFYLYGLDSNALTRKFLEEPAILNSVLESTIPEEAELDLTSSHVQTDSNKTDAISIFGTSYESSGDELSCSFSPSKGRGILKRLSSSRYFVGRSISESDLDDIVCSSVDSALPEDGEMSASLKKTVRFNNVIKRQLYRSNSSILGQKKKNQRKSRNKKRAQERRHSESEASEFEDKKDEEDDEKTGEDALENEDDDDEDEKSTFVSHEIFDMDLL